MRRKSELSVEEFRRYWNDPQFTALIERVAALTGATRFARSATLAVEANVLVREKRGTQEPYDGVLEYWWDNAAHLIARTDSPEGQALTEEMLGYQRQFVDLGASTAFFTEA
ncbi:MAG: EthD domain-containing protein [Pseudomonadota bacterium]|nr:MAG: EthD domain-containing protein [Pseudomonadota bacterium]